jgi:CRISPR-associated protein Cas5h
MTDPHDADDHTAPPAIATAPATATATGDTPHDWHMDPPEAPETPASASDPDAAHPPSGATALSFTITSDFGHFRKIEGNAVRQTYRVIPKTTLAGLLAAIAGLPRDSYYHLFAADVAQVAISPTGPLRTVNLPQLRLSTSEEKDYRDRKFMASLPGDEGESSAASVTIPDPAASRQRRNIEALVEPGYRVDLWLVDGPLRDRLQAALSEGWSVFPPTMGVSNEPVSITYHGEQPIGEPITTDRGPESHPDNGEVTEERGVLTDSAIPAGTDALAPATKPVVTERSQSMFRAGDRDGDYRTDIGRQRVTTGFQSWAVQPDGTPIRVDPSTVSIRPIGDRRVVFA